jgi:hypothetical protein
VIDIDMEDMDFDNIDKEVLNSHYIFRAKENNNFIVATLNNNMKKDILKTGIDYNLNSKNFRCDEFIKNHDKKHILFAGCSNTFGEGVEYEKTWAYRLYKEICKEELLTGYFNLGVSGASIFEILVNVNRYIREYSMPDAIFLLLPEIERDIRYFKNPEISLTTIISELYNQLQLLCEKTNTVLISTSWLNIDEESMSQKIAKEYNKSIDVKTRNGNYATMGHYSFLSDINPYNELKLLEKYTKTFKVLDQTNTYHYVYEYSLKNKDRDVFIAADVAKHHGEGFHYAWFKNFYERYLNEKNNI